MKRSGYSLAYVAVALSGFAVACSAESPAEPASPADASAGAPDAQPPVDATGPCTGFGCFDGAGSSSDASLGARAIAQLSSCAASDGCHIVGSAPSGLVFRGGSEFATILNVPSSERPDLFRVKPGDPLQSYLYLKVLGDGGIDGGRMPLGADFDPGIPEMFFAWIEAGAPDAM